MALDSHTHYDMDEFEATCIRFLARGGLLEADIVRQLPFVRVVDRIHDSDGRCTVFSVDREAPRIIPRDSGISADLEIAGVGAVQVDLDIGEGELRFLAVDHGPDGWPPTPVVLGISPYPEP